MIASTFSSCKIYQCAFRKTLSFFIILLSIAIEVSGQDNQNPYLADFDELVQKLVTVHPDPYSNYGGQIEFYRKKQDFEKQIERVSSEFELALRLNKFLSILGDGHTFISYPKNSEEQREKLPLDLKASNNQLFIQNASSLYADHIGKRVLSINDVPLADLVKKTNELYPSENISGSYFNLIRTLRSRASSKLLLEPSEQLTFVLEDQDETHTLDVKYENNPMIITRESKLNIEKSNGLLDWDILGEQTKVGYLSWNSVLSREVLEEAYQTTPESVGNFLGWAYSFLNKSRPKDPSQAIQLVPVLYEEFSQLASAMLKEKSEYLIIDLRNNSGGWTPIIDPLLYMIHGEKFLNFDFEAQYIKRISGNDSSNASFQYSFGRLGGLDLELPFAERMAQVKNGYAGFGKAFVKDFQAEGFEPTILVLTSPTTFSAAYHFTYFLRKLGKAHIVGVASRQAGNSFMETTPIVLTESQLKGSISNAKQILFKNDPEMGKTLKPDYPMNWKDYKAFNFDRNAEVLKALELINSSFVKE